jgi:hypothetical protein
VKELVGVIQVALVGQRAEGDNLASGLRIQKGARNRNMGLNLLDMIHGQALVQQGESSLTTCFHVFGANPDFIPLENTLPFAFMHMAQATHTRHCGLILQSACSFLAKFFLPCTTLTRHCGEAFFSATPIQFYLILFSLSVFSLKSKC